MNNTPNRKNPAYNLNKPGTPPGLKILADAGITITPAIYQAFMAPSGLTVADLVRRHGQIALGPDFDPSHKDGATQFPVGLKRQIARVLIDLFHFAGQVPVCNLPENFGESFLDHIRQNRKPGTSKLLSATLAKAAARASGVFRSGIEAGLCSHDPFRDLAHSPVLRPVLATRSLRPAKEINLLLKTAYTHDKLIFLAMVLARLLGARCLELLALRRKDLEEELNQITIPGRKNNPHRILEMPLAVTTLIALLPTMDPRDRMIPLTSAAFARRMAAVAKKAGVRPLGKDELRRWFAMELQWSYDPTVRSDFSHSKPARTSAFYLYRKTPTFEAVVKRLIERSSKTFRQEDLI